MGRDPFNILNRRNWNRIHVNASACRSRLLAGGTFQRECSCGLCRLIWIRTRGFNDRIQPALLATRRARKFHGEFVVAVHVSNTNPACSPRGCDFEGRLSVPVRDGDFVAAPLELKCSHVGVFAIMDVPHSRIIIAGASLICRQSLLRRQRLNFGAPVTTEQQGVGAIGKDGFYGQS